MLFGRFVFAGDNWRKACRPQTCLLQTCRRPTCQSQIYCMGHKPETYILSADRKQNNLYDWRWVVWWFEHVLWHSWWRRGVVSWRFSETPLPINCYSHLRSECCVLFIPMFPPQISGLVKKKTAIGDRETPSNMSVALMCSAARRRNGISLQMRSMAVDLGLGVAVHMAETQW